MSAYRTSPSRQPHHQSLKHTNSDNEGRTYIRRLDQIRDREQRLPLLRAPTLFRKGHEREPAVVQRVHVQGVAQSRGLQAWEGSRASERPHRLAHPLPYVQLVIPPMPNTPHKQNVSTINVTLDGHKQSKPEEARKHERT